MNTGPKPKCVGSKCKIRRISLLWIALTLTIAFALFGCTGSTGNHVLDESDVTGHETIELEIDRSYSDPLEVAEYILAYRKLPSNYITKKDAVAAGWESSKGNLWEVTDKMSIGGDVFGNREGSLPDIEGRVWYECDVNYSGGFRGKERLVYSNDWLIYYTDDHYETFQLLELGDK